MSLGIQYRLEASLGVDEVNDNRNSMRAMENFGVTLLKFRVVKMAYLASLANWK